MSAQKQTVVSFNTTKEVKDDLKKIPKYTKIIEAVVCKTLGRCPVCKQKLQEK